MTPLTKIFTLEELVFSQTAAREGIDNAPGPAHVRAIMTATFPEAGGVVYKKISRRAALKL